MSEKSDFRSGKSSSSKKKALTREELDALLRENGYAPISESEPEPEVKPCGDLTLEEAEECRRKLDAWIEAEQRRQEREAAKKAAAAAEQAKADAEAKAAAEKAKADAEKAKADAEKAKADAEARLNAGKAWNGAGLGYEYYQPKTGTYGLTKDIWKARSISNGTYTPVWVWYVNGIIDHVLSDEEQEKYVP